MPKKINLAFGLRITTEDVGGSRSAHGKGHLPRGVVELEKFLAALLLFLVCSSKFSYTGENFSWGKFNVQVS